MQTIDNAGGGGSDGIAYLLYFWPAMIPITSVLWSVTLPLPLAGISIQQVLPPVTF